MINNSLQDCTITGHIFISHSPPKFCAHSLVSFNILLLIYFFCLNLRLQYSRLTFQVERDRSREGETSTITLKFSPEQDPDFKLGCVQGEPGIFPSKLSCQPMALFLKVNPFVLNQT